MMLAHYLNDLICACSEHAFGQDAIDHAITTGFIQLTGDRATDLATIMAQYDAIIDRYRSHLAGTETAAA